MAQRFRRLQLGVRRRAGVALRDSLSALAIYLLFVDLLSVWSVAEDLISDHPGFHFTGAGLIALVAFLRSAWEPGTVSFALPTARDTQLTIKFGDLFDEPADLLIPANEYFDHELGEAVSPTSVHGGLIARSYRSNGQRFREEVDAALASEPSTAACRVGRPANKYSIGTTAVLRDGERKAFVFALTNTDLVTSKASADVPMLWAAVTKALHKVDAHGNGEPLALPLIGNGRSGVGLPAQHLLRLLVVLLAEFDKK